MPPLRIALIGPLQIFRGEEALGPPAGRKVSLLLALLALRGGRPAERGALAGILWPESDAERGAMNLRRVLADLRRYLGPDATVIVAPNRQIVRIDADAVVCDVDDFRAAATRFERTGDVAAAEHALALVRGPLLEGIDDDWIVAERAALHERTLTLATALGRVYLAREEWDRAVRTAQEALSLDPLRQTLHAVHLEGLARRGDLPSARQAYRDLRIALRRQTGLDPEPDLRQLMERLRADDARRGGSTPPTPLPLPVYLTPWFGRQKEERLIRARLEEPETRLVTLTGIGGIGKTRLAVAVARSVPERLFVDLSVLDADAPLDALWEATALALGLTVRDKNPRAVVLESIFGMPTLIVLDNAEHVLQATIAYVRQALFAAPQLTILVTSRVPLGIAGETVWPVPTLTQSATALFVARARAAAPHFALTETNRPLVEQLCHRLDGIPLAIEFAAARLRHLSLERIVAGVDDRFRLLRGAAETRQTSMESALTWSWNLLNATQQDILGRLALFPTSFSVELADAVAGADEAMLQELADHSLVVFGERCHLLETVRAFALARLEASGAAPEAQTRFARVYADWLDGLYPQLWQADEGAAMARFAVERQNVNVAVLAADHEISPRLLNALCQFWDRSCAFTEASATLKKILSRYDGQLAEGWRRGLRGWECHFAIVQNRLEEAQIQLEGLLAEVEEPDEQVALLCSLVDCCWRRGDIDRTERYAQTMERLCRRQSDDGWLPHALNALAQCAQARGHGVEAFVRWSESLAIARRRQSVLLEMVVLQAQGKALLASGRGAEARHSLEESLELAERHNDTQYALLALRALGTLSEEAGDSQAARVYHDEAQRLVRLTGDSAVAGALAATAPPQNAARDAA
jgi:predicted ATPase/DNA-binding SARP family transcriptional activator